MCTAVGMFIDSASNIYTVYMKTEYIEIHLIIMNIIYEYEHITNLTLNTEDCSNNIYLCTFMESHWFNRFPKTCPAARPGLRGGTAAAAALGAGRLHLRAAAGSGRGGPRRTAGGGAPCVAVRRWKVDIP